jgi:taurine dioxygenase
MTAISFDNLQPGLPFGSLIRGVTRANLADENSRMRVWHEFESRGLLVFDDIEQTSEMQLALSGIFGPLKDHPVAEVKRAEEDLAAGIIDLHSGPDHDPTIVELDGTPLHNWLPWHFDHAYNDELNRAGVLRAVVIAPEGGMTGFIDGIALYKALSPDLRAQVDGLHVLYSLQYLIGNMRFGKPPGLIETRAAAAAEKVIEAGKKWPRSVHPAVWTRPQGERVLHVSLLHAAGIEGREDAAGDALLEALCTAINANAGAYFHRWKPGQMLVWDNWRVLHCVTGTDPRYPRRLFRTTISGDYGLGYFEKRTPDSARDRGEPVG